jgi:hypothetical protein
VVDILEPFHVPDTTVPKVENEVTLKLLVLTLPTNDALPVNDALLNDVLLVIELIAATKLALADVPKLDRTPNEILMLEKLLSTSEFVKGEPLTVAPV